MTHRPTGEPRAAAVLPHGRRNFLAERLYAENRRAIMRVIVDAAINGYRIPRLEDLAERTGCASRQRIVISGDCTQTAASPSGASLACSSRGCRVAGKLLLLGPRRYLLVAGF